MDRRTARAQVLVATTLLMLLVPHAYAQEATVDANSEAVLSSDEPTSPSSTIESEDDPFAAVWESSRSNSWSWAFPTVLGVGILSVVLASFIPRPILRQVTKVFLVMLCGGLAVEASSLQIQEKWRIRGEWAANNPDEMTQKGWAALAADGANLTMGPFLMGALVILTLSIICAIMFAIRWGNAQVRARQNAE